MCLRVYLQGVFQSNHERFVFDAITPQVPRGDKPVFLVHFAWSLLCSHRETLAPCSALNLLCAGTTV